MKEIKESIILNELKKYVELLDEHYLTLENKKAEGEDDNKLLLKVIKNVKKLIVRKSNQLTSLKEGEEWRDRIITELERDRKLWWGIEESHDVAEFKKLVGVEKFDKLMGSWGWSYYQH